MSDANRKTVNDAQSSAVANTVTGLFATLADTMPQMVWATDANGSHFYFNRRWYEYTGLSEEESMGFGFATILHPDDVERTLIAWRAAWERNAEYEIEYRFRGHDGVYRWFVGRAMPVLDNETWQVRMWVGTCTDIDDTRRAYDALRESQGRLSVAIQSARLGLWEFDFATGLAYFDESTRELFGLTGDRPFTGTEINDLVHEDDREQSHAALARAITGEDKNYFNRYRIRRADNTVRYAQAMAARFTDENGAVTRLAGVVQDVTEAQSTLEALRDSADALRESDSLFRSVVTNAPIIVFVLDKNGVITLMEGAALGGIGRMGGQMVGISVFDLYADAPDIQEHIRRALAGENREWTNSYNGITFESRVTPIIGVDGVQEGIVGVSFDVTERNKASDALGAREEQYRFLFDTVASGVVYQDGNGVILDANPAAEQILGLTLAQMQGRDSTDPRWKAVRLNGSPFPGDEHPVSVALRTGQVIRNEPMGVFNPTEERYRWLSVSAVPLFKKGEDKPGLIYAYFEDETEQREAQNKLRESEERFRALADNIAQLAWMGNANGDLFWYNQRWFDYTGTTLDEVYGQGWQAVHHPDYAEPVTAKFLEHVQRGEEWEDTFPIRSKNGEYRWFLSRAVPIRDADGNILRWFGTNTDITEQRDAEVALGEYATKQAKVAEILQRSLLSTPPPDAFPGITVSTHYVAALDEAQVGGDFFDVFALGGGRVAFVLGDVTGKGIQAAEHTGQIKYGLRAFLREEGDPGSALRRINTMLCDSRHLDIYRNGEEVNAMAAVVIAVLDTSTGEIAIAGGGAESPLLYNSATGSIEEVFTVGTSVGAYEESVYEVETRTLNPGDLFLMGTDGITEARRGKREFFGIEGFACVVSQTAQTTTEPEEVAVAVIEAAKAYSINGTLRDDVCLLAVRRN